MVCILFTPETHLNSELNDQTSKFLPESFWEDRNIIINLLLNKILQYLSVT